MTTSLTNLGAITLFVEDLERAKRFYAVVFGLKLLFEDGSSAAFDFGNTMINLLGAPSAGSLIEPATVGGPEAGSRFQLTIWVEDADATCAQLVERGVELLNGPIDREWGMRTAAFTDPAGHVWEVAQSLSPDADT
jgi:catechol 2,3-dioxygenase-like lactoylglutathione lyase family enzyme